MDPNAKSAWSSKTLWASIITMVLGALTATGWFDFSGVTEAEIQAWAGGIVTVLGLVFGVLRLVTKAPVTVKAPPATTPALAVMLVLVAGLALSACTAVTTAETPAQRAYAVIGTYAVLAEEAAILAENPDTPDHVVRAIGLADQVTWPVVATVTDAVRAWSALAEQLAVIEAAGGTPAETLAAQAAAALSELSQAIARAGPVVSDFGQVIATIRKGEPA